MLPLEVFNLHTHKHHNRNTNLLHVFFIIVLYLKLYTIAQSSNSTYTLVTVFVFCKLNWITKIKTNEHATQVKFFFVEVENAARIPPRCIIVKHRVIEGISKQCTKTSHWNKNKLFATSTPILEKRSKVRLSDFECQTINGLKYFKPSKYYLRFKRIQSVNTLVIGKLLM